MNLFKNVFLLTFSFLIVACNDAKIRPRTEVPKPPPVSPDGTIKEEVVEKSLEMWHLESPTSGFEGISLTHVEAYSGVKPVKEIIVAVIDSGVDISHVALKNKIWVNEKEIAGNGIDDDKNGYIDDIHGWNFMGNKDGENIDFDTLEVTREALRYDKKLAAGEHMSAEEIKYFEAIKKDFEERLIEAKANLGFFERDYHPAKEGEQLLKTVLAWTDFTKEGLEKIDSDDANVLAAKTHLLKLVTRYKSLENFYSYYDYYKGSLDYNYNKNFDPRATIVKNDDTDFSEFNYGNNDVTGPDSSHGTHVAGIIAAEASPLYKTRGISQNVKIMVLRAVPNGDERDKDIVAAVRYAVKNGAKIINMSFGKTYSPFKSEVDKAFLFAEENDVLLVHAAGNSNKNIDVESNFPNRKLVNAAVLDRSPEVQGWLEVGASSMIKGLPLLADFSNFGVHTVDLFAPGVKILSTTPDQNYEMYSGTSMASPVVAGSAALIMNHYSITAQQTRKLMMDQVRTEYDRVRLPGAEKFDLPVFLKDISITGGLLDLHKSMVLAEQLSK